MRVNGKCAIVDMREPKSHAACNYFIGQPSDGPCKRCSMPYLAHYPELQRPKRVRGVIAAVCDVCAYPVDSDQHVNRCRG